MSFSYQVSRRKRKEEAKHPLQSMLIAFFYAAWQRNNPGKTWVAIFATAAMKGKISFGNYWCGSFLKSSTLRLKMQSSVHSISWELVIDRFGHLSQTFSIQASVVSMIELPGVDNQEASRIFSRCSKTSVLGSGKKPMKSVCSRRSSTPLGFADTIANPEYRDSVGLQQGYRKRIPWEMRWKTIGANCPLKWIESTSADFRIVGSQTFG